jgi:glycosyltransferase involved in cell wall biosynthesis
MPLVSVVIATKNRPALLVRAIMSVFDQTIADLEVIVVMDGEGEETAARLNAITDPRLRVYVNPVSLGSGSARNIGASQAQGDWIAFLDDDDEWLPTKLERQLALATPDDERVILTCLSAYVTPLGTSVRPRSIFNNDIPFDEWLFDRRQLFGGDSFIQTSSLMIRTNLFRQIGFPAHGQHEDWEFVIVLLKRLDTVLLTVPEVLVRHYAEEDRASLTATGKLERSLLWLDEMRGLLTRRAFSGFCLTVVAHQARRVGGWRECRQLLGKAFRHGRPTLFQLGIFLIVWSVPRRLHLALRRLRPTPAQRQELPVGSATRQYVS